MLYIVRHGQSQRNLTLSGPFDCELTELGKRQADRAGAWLAGKGIQTVYCSPAIRTLQTATAVSRHLGVKPVAWADLVEWGFLFDCPGLTGKEMRGSYPEIAIGAEFSDDTCWIDHKNTETWSELSERARGCLLRLLSQHPVAGPPVALVTHAHFARYLVSEALGYTEPAGLGGVIQHYNCGVSALEFTPERRILWFANEHGYLGDLLTK